MSDNKSKVIIAVDDNPSGLKLIEMTLTSKGYTFFGASSGKECIDLAYRMRPKLILLDIQMPYMDGFETCRKLRAQAHLSAIPIVFVTALNTKEEVEQALAAGGNDFLVKPITPAQLLQRVERWT